MEVKSESKNSSSDKAASAKRYSSCSRSGKHSGQKGKYAWRVSSQNVIMPERSTTNTLFSSISAFSNHAPRPTPRPSKTGTISVPMMNARRRTRVIHSR